MLHREKLERPDYVYPADEWRMVEKRFYPRLLAQNETFFSTANGYLGMRGCFDEGTPCFSNGTFVNGFYESWPIVYGEEAYGFARTGQTIVNVTDATIIKLYVDDEPFYLPTANLVDFERVLDMQHGTLHRDLLWETPAGKVVSIKSRRLVSFEHRHLAAITYEVTVLNAGAPLTISSEMVYRHGAKNDDGDPRRHRGFAERALHPQQNYSKDRRVVLSHATKRSQMTLACGVEHSVATECSYSVETRCSEDEAKVVFSVAAQPGESFRITKFIAYHTSRSAPVAELCERTERTLDRAARQGFEELRQGQRRYVDAFWKRSDVEIRGDTSLQQAIRFNLFHILQATARAEGVGVPAKGLTGEGYEGHYFWDTEIYVLPFLTYTEPRIARNLLKFRHSMLDKARQRAREVNQKGALFPWRTINGEEASAYYAAGTAQYHINADIVYALRKYVNATGDNEFLYEVGADMLVETARLWRDLGFYSERKNGQFCIAGVTGPDEYNTVVNNNTYTNLMARENLWYAAATIETLRDKRRVRYQALVDRTGLEPHEVDEWKEAAASMYLPYDEKRGIHPQDDDFLDRRPWDFENTPPDKYPLLLHHHPLVIYRHQVIKQADVVMAMFLLGDEFSMEEKQRNFDFYDPITTGDSSLSACIQSIEACEVRRIEKAFEYSRYALLMDLADIGGNAADGCHIASMGGTWMVVVYGLAGFRDYGGRFRFGPIPPARAEEIRFPLTLRGQILDVALGREGITYTLREGDGLTIWHFDEEIRLSPEDPSCSREHAEA
ncbi:MAG: glycosyl hydrolase family 65 protein [Myxococcota bacterium]